MWRHVYGGHVPGVPPSRYKFGRRFVLEISFCAEEKFGIDFDTVVVFLPLRSFRALRLPVPPFHRNPRMSCCGGNCGCGSGCKCSGGCGGYVYVVLCCSLRSALVDAPMILVLPPCLILQCLLKTSLNCWVFLCPFFGLSCRSLCRVLRWVTGNETVLFVLSG